MRITLWNRKKKEGSIEEGRKEERKDGREEGRKDGMKEGGNEGKKEVSKEGRKERSNMFDCVRLGADRASCAWSSKLYGSERILL